MNDDDRLVPPENVRLVMKDGMVLPAECRYDGLVNGVHMWVVVVPRSVPCAQLQSIKADMLPARTGLSLELAPDDGP